MTSEQQYTEPRTDEHHQVIDKPEERLPTEMPEVTDEHRARAKKMVDDYDEDRPTVTLPGTGGTVAGTAINEWLDDGGNPKFSAISKDEG
jgi:hypothetical protein